MSSRIAVYAGSFDPVQNGHIDVLQRATHIFDVVHVLIAPNADKTPLLSTNDRDLIFCHEAETHRRGYDISAVPIGDVLIAILPPDDLTVLYAHRVKAEYLVRGVRNQMDWAYEQTIQHANARLCRQFGIPELETVYLGAPLNDSLYVSSSLVRGLLKAGDWQKAIGAFVPYSTIEMLEKRRQHGNGA